MNRFTLSMQASKLWQMQPAVAADVLLASEREAVGVSTQAAKDVAIRAAHEIGPGRIEPWETLLFVAVIARSSKSSRRIGTISPPGIFAPSTACIRHTPDITSDQPDAKREQKTRPTKAGFPCLGTSILGDGPFPSHCPLSYTFRMSRMVSARLPNDLVARMDQVGPRSAVIVAALRAYLRCKPAPTSSAKLAGCNKVVQG